AGYLIREHRPYERGVVDTVFGMNPLIVSVGKLMVSGPFSVRASGESPSRRRIFVCRPMSPTDEEPCAKRIVATLAQRAYRRPVTDADVAPLVAAYDDGHREGGFERGVQMAIWQMLVSPDFIYRSERGASTAATAAAPKPKPYRITDLELASRLSFFLWSTLPDEELIDLARWDRLHDPVVLEKQVSRMLSDHKAQALVSNFVGQWLSLRNIPTLGRPQEVFPDFDYTLREAFVTETRMFFENLIDEDRSVLEVLNAD